jgi:hypothetical protein
MSISQQVNGMGIESEEILKVGIDSLHGESVKNVRVLGPRQKIIPPLACLMARLLRYIHPHVSRYALVDVPCRQTTIRRNRVELFLTVTLSQ